MAKNYLEEIQCPKCKIRPKPLKWLSFRSWACDICNHSFDTFKFYGKCSKCKHQHKETMCLTCEKVSRHLDFYPKSRLDTEKSKPNQVVKNDIFTPHKYECPKCCITNYLKLKVNEESKYIYVCNNDLCDFHLNTNRMTSHKFLSLEGTLGGKQLWEGSKDKCNYFHSHINTKCLDCINASKISMLSFFTHFLTCNWGACYHTIFNQAIKPYFDDVEVLKFLLKQYKFFKPGTYRNRNGYFMYPELDRYLLRINNSKIKDFVRNEFREI